MAAMQTVGLGGDLLDDGAALADDLADLVGIDGDLQHLGSEGADLGPGLSDGLEHDLIQNVKAGVAGLFKGFLDDLIGQTVVLDVHLDGGDALFRAAHLEVHVTEEILDALDVGEGDVTVALGHQTAGDAGHGGLDGHTSVHESQGAAADGTLRSGTVGGQDLAHQAERIGERHHRGEDGHQGPFGQSAVTDLTAAGAAGGTGFAHAVAGEVVVVHIALLGLFKGGVQLLGIPERAQSADGEHLGLAAGEHTAAVDAGDETHFGGQGPDLGETAAVHALALVQNQTADHIFLELVHALGQLRLAVGIFLGKVLVNILRDGVDAGVADGLVVGVHGLLHGVHGIALHGLEHLLGDLHAGIDGGLLEVFGLDVADELDEILDDGMAALDGFQHHVIGELVGAGLDHDDLFHAAGHGELELGALALLAVGADDVALFLGIAHLDTGDGALPGNVGDRQGDGSAQHGGDLGGFVVIDAEGGAADAHVVAHVRGEEGADLAVDHAGDQDGLLAGTSFPAHKAAGDAAHGIELFFKVHAQGEEIDAVPGGLRHGDAGEDGGVAKGHQGRAVGQAGHFAQLDLELAAAQRGFINAVLGEGCVLDHNWGYHLS